jgi:hypothetical protein
MCRRRRSEILGLKVGRVHRANTKLSGCAMQKLKKLMAGQETTLGTYQPWNLGTPKQVEM